LGSAEIEKCPGYHLHDSLLWFPFASIRKTQGGFLELH